MFVGDEDLIKIEPKRGISLDTVERELSRDFHHLKIVERDLARNTLYITGKPKTSWSSALYTQLSGILRAYATR